MFTDVVLLSTRAPFYGLFRTGVQTFDNGVDPRVTQWVNSLQLFANFNATPTERFLIEFRPLDNTSNFSGYNFEPTSGPDSGWQNALNGRLYQLFFEGNFLSLFSGLDNGRNYLLGFDFAIGRQQLFLQSGVLINDTIDMVDLTHPSLFWLDGSATTATLIYGWGNIHRSGGYLSNSAQLIGGYLRGTLTAQSPPSGLSAQAMDARNPSGSYRLPTPRRLPQRIRLPFQPAKVGFARQALLPVGTARHPDRPDDLRKAGTATRC